MKLLRSIRNNALPLYIAVGLFLILPFYPSSSQILTWPLRLFPFLMLLFLGGFFCFRIKVFLESGIFRSWIYIGVAFVLWFFISSISQDAGGASKVATYVIFVMLGPVVFSLASDYREDVFLGATGLFLTILAAIIAAVSLCQWFNDLLVPVIQKLNFVGQNNGGYAPELKLEKLRNVFPFGHSNYVAGFFILLFPWVTQAAIQSDRRLLRFFAVPCLVLIVGIVFSTGSRAGVLCLGILVSFYGLSGVLKLFHNRASRLLLGGLLVVMLLVVSLSNTRLRNTVVSIFQEKSITESDSQRSIMYQTGFNMIGANWVTGVGAGMVPFEYPAYVSNTLNGISTVKQLHCTPIQIAAELGIIGLLLFVAWFAYPLILYFRRNRRIPFNWGGAAVLSTLSYAVFMLFDFQLDFEVFPVLLGTNLGIIIYTGSVSDIRKIGKMELVVSKTFQFLLLAIVVIVAVFSISDLISRFYWRKAVDAYYQNDFVLYAEHAENAIRANNHDPYYKLDLGLRSRSEPSLAQLEYTKIDGGELLKGLLKKYPHFEIILTHLGWLELSSDPVRSELYFIRSAELVEGRSYTFVGLGLCKFLQNDRDGAIQSFAIEAMYNPTFLTHGFWEQDAFAPLKDEVINQIRNWVKNAESGVKHGKWGIWMDELLQIFESGTVPAPSNLKSTALREFSNSLYLTDKEKDENLVYHLIQKWKNPAYSLKREFFFWKKRPMNQDLLNCIEQSFVDKDTFPILDLMELGSDELKKWYRIRSVERPGFSFVMDHPEMQIPKDPVTIVENGLVEDFLTNLFPKRQDVPSAFIKKKIELLHSSR